jgi:hypothetical protein
MGDLDKLHWFVVFVGIADRYLWGFEADGWQMLYGDPAMGHLGILPTNGRAPATIDDARWLADAFAFDHDAPVGIWPAWVGDWPTAMPKDQAAHPVIQPVIPFERSFTSWYWEHINMSYMAAAELRFNGSLVLRYDGEATAPGTTFSARFRGREEQVGLYAMAVRQPDPLAEYLCLYRVLESAERSNGKAFIRSNLPAIWEHDFGELIVMPDDPSNEPGLNAFDVYLERARDEVSRLSAAGITDLADYLYDIRNSLAHGKHRALTARHVHRFEDAGRALVIVRLLARIAVEP